MSSTRLLGLSTTILLAISALPVQSQLRSRSTAQSRVNERHEQLKRQADETYRTGDYQRVLQLTESVLRENPRDHVAMYLRGSARIEIGSASADRETLRGGIADVREAIRLNGTSNPNYYLPYLAGMTRLSAVEGRQEHAKTAVTVADQLITQLRNLQPGERANLVYQRAMSQFFLEDYDKAIADFQAALGLERQHLGALIGLADAYAAANRQDQALQTYSRAVEADPDNPLVHNNRGMFLQKQGQLERAITDFTRSLELDPRYFYALTNRGFSLMESGNPEAAEADYTASLRVNPNQPGVYSLRGTARVAQGDLPGALADHQQVVQLDPGSAIALADVGFVQFFAGSYEQALAAFEKALERDASVHYVDPWMYAALGHLDRADAARQRFAAAGAKESAKRTWPEQLLAYQTGSQSAEQLLTAVDQNDASARKAQLCEAHFFIGQQQLQSNNPGQAAEHFRQAVETDARQLSAYRGAQLALKQFTAAAVTPSAAN